MTILSILLAALAALASPTPFVVGPENMPDEIAPVTAPFPTIEFSRPVFPSRTITVKMNRSGLSTALIQNAIDKTAKKGGGTVIIPAGEWYSGRIILRSNVNLHLSEGCVIYSSGDIKDYLPVVLTRDEGVNIYSLGGFIYAHNEKNIALTGKGKIIGATTDCEIFERERKVTKSVETAATPIPLEQRIFDGHDGTAVYLPKTICMVKCEKVLIEGVTLERGLFWNVVTQYCNNVIIRGVTVSSHGHGRTDGIDIDSSRDVLIEYCSMDCQDDCYTMKSGRGDDGLATAVPTENVVVRNCLALRGTGGLVTGTETAGGIKNIYMRDCLFNGTDQGFRFKTRRPRGGGAESIFAENIKMNVRKEAFFIDMLGSAVNVGSLASRYPAPEVNRFTPYLHSILITDVQVDGCRDLFNVRGLPESHAQDISLENFTVKCKTIGRIQDADNFFMKDISVETDDPAIFLDSVSNPIFFRFTNSLTGKPVEVITVNQ